MNSFSPQLIDRLIRYMQTEHGITLTPEEANERLKVYGDFFLAFAKDGGRAPARRLSARGAQPDGDLINSTLNENEIN